jgi:hypothetical protein
MASTTAAIRTALKAALDDATYGVTGWQTSAYMLAQPQPPSIDIRPAGTRFDTAMGRGNDDMTFMVRAMVAFNSDQGAQIKLDTLIDATSAGGLKTVLEHDKTLGGVISNLRVMDVSDYKALIVEGAPPMLAVEFTVEVLP